SRTLFRSEKRGGVGKITSIRETKDSLAAAKNAARPLFERSETVSFWTCVVSSSTRPWINSETTSRASVAKGRRKIYTQPSSHMRTVEPWDYDVSE
ncbi:hypothetical protein K0M31_009403, partial [Melipona bicolor]